MSDPAANDHRPGWTLGRIQQHIAEGLPFPRLLGLKVSQATPEKAVVIIPRGPLVTRPGGIVAGPVLFSAADVALYALILARIDAPMSVTVDLTMNFLRPGADFPLICTATPLRFGRRIVAGEVRIAPSTDPDRLVAFATGNYAVGETSTGSRQTP